MRPANKPVAPTFTETGQPRQSSQPKSSPPSRGRDEGYPCKDTYEEACGHTVRLPFYPPSEGADEKPKSSPPSKAAMRGTPARHISTDHRQFSYFRR